MNNTTNSAPCDDEIDLKELLKKISKALERGMKIILITIVLGGLVGIAYFYKGSVNYQSNLVLSSNMLALANVQALLNPIETLIEEENVALLSKDLNLSPKTVDELKELTVESIFEKESDNKEIKSYFEVTATVTDNAILPELQKGIVYYLQNNDFVKKRENVKKERFSALIKKADEEIKKLDLLQEKIANGSSLPSSDSRVVLMENIYLQGVEMAEMKEDYIEELALVESMQVVKGFTPFTKPSSPSWIICLLVGVVGGLITGLGIVFLKELDRYVRS